MHMYTNLPTVMKINFIFMFVLFIGIISAATIEINKIKIDHDDKVNYNKQTNSFDFSQGGSLNVVYNGNKYSYSDLSSVDFKQGGATITKNPQIVFGSDGKIKEAYFTTGKDGNYALGNEILQLPSGTKVAYKDGKAIIQIPGKTFTPPKQIDRGNVNSYMFYSHNDQGIQLGEYLIKGGLGYEKGNYFIQDQTSLALADFVIANPNHVKTYIDFEGRQNYAYQGAYISFDKSRGVFVLGSNVNAPSPSVMFTKDNTYGLKFDSDKDYFAIRSSGGSSRSYFKITKSAPGIVPEMENFNDFWLDQNGRGFASIDGNLIGYKSHLIKDFGEHSSSSSVAVTLSGLYRTRNSIVERTIGNQVMGFSNFNEYAFGPNKRFIRLKHYKNHPAFFTGISDVESYNYDLTEKGFERLTGINLIAEDSSGTSYLNDPKNIRYLYDLVASIPKQQKNMLDEMHFHSHTPWAYGFAQYSGDHFEVHFTVGQEATASGNRLSAETWRHEMGHIVDFYGGRKGNFDKMWYNTGIDNKVIVSGYAHKNGERISEFIGHTAFASDSEIKELLGNNWHQDKIKRAAFAVAWYNYGFTDERISEIFSGVGLKYDRESMYGYMMEVGINIQ